jgi:hypothetical protein
MIDGRTLIPLQTRSLFSVSDRYDREKVVADWLDTLGFLRLILRVHGSLRLFLHSISLLV